MGKVGIPGSNMSGQAQRQAMQCSTVMVMARDLMRIVRNQSEICAHGFHCLWLY